MEVTEVKASAYDATEERKCAQSQSPQRNELGQTRPERHRSGLQSPGL